MDIAILVFTVLGVLIAAVALLPQLGFDIRIFGRSEMASEVRIKNTWRKKPWPALAMLALSICVSAGAFYYFFRPRIVEKIVEKPVDRIVEKPIPAPPIDCPKSMTPPQKSAPKKADAAPPTVVKQSLIDNQGQIGEVTQTGNNISNGVIPAQTAPGIYVSPGSQVTSITAKDLDICLGSVWVCFVKNERFYARENDAESFEQRIIAFNRLVDLRMKYRPPEEADRCRRVVAEAIQSLRDNIQDETATADKLLANEPPCLKPR